MLSAADALGPVQSMERVQARRQGDFDNPIGLPFTYFLVLQGPDFDDDGPAPSSHRSGCVLFAH
jgi:hypothetical protein